MIKGGKSQLARDITGAGDIPIVQFDEIVMTSPIALAATRGHKSDALHMQLFDYYLAEALQALACGSIGEYQRCIKEAESLL